MTTMFDFITMAIFAGLVVLYLQRSIDQDEHKDHLWQYLLASIGCAIANYLGNQGMILAGAVLIVADLAFITHVLQPFSFIHDE